MASLHLPFALRCTKCQTRMVYCITMGWYCPKCGLP